MFSLIHGGMDEVLAKPDHLGRELLGIACVGLLD